MKPTLYQTYEKYIECTKSTISFEEYLNTIDILQSKK